MKFTSLATGIAGVGVFIGGLGFLAGLYLMFSGVDAQSRVFGMQLVGLLGPVFGASILIGILTDISRGVNN